MLVALGYKKVNDQMVITSKCFHCKEVYDQSISLDQWYAWQVNGNYVQDVFPGWSDSQREQLMSGTHPECWDKMFAGSES